MPTLDHLLACFDAPRAGAVLAAYLLGSVPFGLLVARAIAGTDVRTVGSGNIGATNVARAAGRKAAVLTLLLDAGKGFVPALVGRELVGGAPAAVAAAQAGALGLDPAAVVAAALGFAAFLGHVFSVFLRLKGGKGVATAFGVCAALVPEVAAAAVAVFAAMYLASRIVSISSLGAALTAVGLAFALADPTFAVTVLAMVAVIFARHAGNIRRLLGRREHRV